MGIEGFFTIGIVILMAIGLALEIASADFIVFGALVSLMLVGIVSPGEAFAGFSNQGMLTVGILFVISKALQNTGALRGVVKYFLSHRHKDGLSRSMLKMMVPVSFVSAFLNNTPIVVAFAPAVKKWAERLDVSASKFLIPLSYAAIFGGMCTLIGTSTNLVIHGLMLENNIEGIAMFELAKIGIPCALIGWLYLAFIGKKILPERKGIRGMVSENRKEYVVELEVTGEYEFIGKTIQEAGLRNLKGLFLLDIERNNKSLGPVSSEEPIREGDHLIFVGVTSAVADLHEILGLVSLGEKVLGKDMRSFKPQLVEAVVSSGSPVLGKTVKECNFRGRYGAGIVAVHRNGQRVREKIGGIRLRPGDTLLLLTSRDFFNKWADSQDFYVVSHVKAMNPRLYHKAYIALTIVTLMVLGATFGKFLPKIGGQQISIVHTAFAAAILMVITRCVRATEAKNSIRLDILIIIASAFGISKALANSGAADFIAKGIITINKGLGPVGVLAGVYLVTSLFTAVITNNATAALMFPIAYAAASQLSLDPRPFFITIAIAASASFITPMAYQTNLIVQGAGGYKFRDYFRVGLPLNILLFITAVIIIPFFWKF